MPIPTSPPAHHVLTDTIQYAFASQAQLHGYDPKDAVVELFPRPGEYSLREEDILNVITEQGSSIALVIFSGVQYYTGQWFPMESITKAAKKQVRTGPPSIRFPGSAAG